MNRSVVNIISAVIGVLVFALFASAFVLAHGGECTQGSTDSYMVGLFYCGILSVVTALFFILSNSMAGVGRYHRLIVPFVTIGLIWFVRDKIFSVLFQGHHLCGEEYDDMTYDRTLSRMFYPLQGIYFLMVNVTSLWPLFRKRSK
jgi:hypothetical protein